MIIARAHLKSISPYSQSAPINVEKEEGEAPDAFDERTWRLHLHTQNGTVYIPPSQIKAALDGAGPFLGKKIKGKGNKTWAKVITTGVLVTDGIDLGIKPEDVQGEKLYLNADGKKGSGTRVWRMYPRIDSWEGEIDIYVINPEIKQSILEEHLVVAGRFIGLGRWRPENRGMYGRFSAKITSWTKEE